MKFSNDRQRKAVMAKFNKFSDSPKLTYSEQGISNTPDVGPPEVVYTENISNPQLNVETLPEAYNTVGVSYDGPVFTNQEEEVVNPTISRALPVFTNQEAQSRREILEMYGVGSQDPEKDYYEFEGAKRKARNDNIGLGLSVDKGLLGAQSPAYKFARKSLDDFIKEHREEIDRATNSQYKNDDERRLWVMNDEGLYRWARSEGVRI